MSSRGRHQRYGVSVLPCLVFSAFLCVATSVKNVPVDYCQANLQAGSGEPGNWGGADMALVMAVVVARHGDRTPANILPHEGEITWEDCGDARTDTIPSSKAPFSGFAYSQPPPSSPYASGLWRGSCTDGQLTARGAQQHSTLGANLRARWIDEFKLIDAVPPPAHLSFRSTDYPRTRESAENMIGSLLPNGIVGGGAIPLTRRSSAVEDMLANPSRCPRWKERLDELQSSREWVAREIERAPLRAQLDAILATKHVSGWGRSPSIDHYFDALRCRVCHSKPMPCAPKNAECVSTEMASRVFAEGDWEYGLLYSDSELSRLSVAAFLYELYSDFKKAANAPGSTYKLGVRVAHDTTISPLLGTLGVPPTYWVPYASHVEIELWTHSSAANGGGSNGSLSHIRFYFNGQPLKLPACGGRLYCTLEQFQGIAEQGEPVAFAAACQSQRGGARANTRHLLLTSPHSLSLSDLTRWLMEGGGFELFGAGVSLLLVLYFFYFFWSQRAAWWPGLPTPVWSSRAVLAGGGRHALYARIDRDSLYKRSEAYDQSSFGEIGI